MKKITILFAAILLGICVSAQTLTPIVLGNFEDSVPTRFRATSGQSMKSVDNPLKDEVNSSNKVLQMTNNIKNCIVSLDLTKNQKTETKIYTYGYTNVRLKYYCGSITNNEVRIQWNATSDSTSFNLKPKAEGKWEVLDFALPSQDNFTLFQFWFDVRTVDPLPVATDVIYVDDVVLYVKENTAVKSIGDDKPIVCYPNPSTGNTILSLTGNQTIASAKVYDIQGKFVQTIFNGDIKGDNLKIPFNLDKRGLYFVKIVDNNGFSKSIKLTIN